MLFSVPYTTRRDHHGSSFYSEVAKRLTCQERFRESKATQRGDLRTVCGIPVIFDVPTTVYSRRSVVCPLSARPSNMTGGAHLGIGQWLVGCLTTYNGTMRGAAQSVPRSQYVLVAVLHRIVQIQPWQQVIDHADSTAPTWQYELARSCRSGIYLP